MRWQTCCAALALLASAACVSTPPSPTPHITPLLDQGRAYLALYEWDQAIDAFDQAIATAPEAAEAYCLRGLAYASGPGGAAGRSAALADYARCLALAPDGPLATSAQRALAALSAAVTAAPR
jgi:tetratricopeptide (TPR) repeat protein